MALTEIVPAGRRAPAQPRTPTVAVTWRLAAGVAGALHSHAEWRGMGARRSRAMEALLRAHAGSDRACR